MNDQKALLDALMGPSRNSSEKTGDDFNAKNVCKHYLVGFCPNEWFKATKRQMAMCDKIHSDHMKDLFENHPEVEKYRREYEAQFLRFLEKLIAEADQQMQKEQRNVRPASKTVRIPDKLKDHFEELEKDHQEAVKESETKEKAGDLGGAEKAMQKAEGLQKEIKKIQDENMVAFEGEEVCEVCGVRIAIGDGSEGNKHLPGKLHMAYTKIRQTAAELKEKKRQNTVAGEESQDGKDRPGDSKKDATKDGGERRRSRSRSQGRRGDRRRSRSDRGRREYGRDRSRDRRGDRGDRGDRRDRDWRDRDGDDRGRRRR